MLIRVDSCRTSVDSCWPVSGSCWFALNRVDSCWDSCIRIDLLNKNIHFKFLCFFVCLRLLRKWVFKSGFMTSKDVEKRRHKKFTWLKHILRESHVQYQYFCKVLCEKCPNTEFFLVRIFPYSEWIRENTEFFLVTEFFLFSRSELLLELNQHLLNHQWTIVWKSTQQLYFVQIWGHWWCCYSPMASYLWRIMCRNLIWNVF